MPPGGCLSPRSGPPATRPSLSLHKGLTLIRAHAHTHWHACPRTSSYSGLGQPCPPLPAPTTGSCAVKAHTFSGNDSRALAGRVNKLGWGGLPAAPLSLVLGQDKALPSRPPPARRPLSPGSLNSLLQHGHDDRG